MRTVLVGPPGAGKGTQAEILSRTLGVPHISTGELFRAQIAAGTPLGREAARYLDKGDLVPDRITDDMVRERLAQPDVAEGFLLDGFPRTAEQVGALDRMLAESGHALDVVLELTIPEEFVVERLMRRGRKDDNEEVIRRRLRVYQEQTAPLLERYDAIVVQVDAVGTIDEVTERALKALHC